MNQFLLASTESPSGSVTLFFAVVLVALIACLALEEKIHAKKAIIAGVFALISLFFAAAFGILPFDRIVVGSHHVVDHPSMEAVYLDDHEGGHPVLFQQWDASAKSWSVVSDWVPTMRDVVRPMMEADAAKYAAENNITPRDCG